MLVARDIELRRGKTAILQGVSLSLAPGEVVAVIGPNGAGKSTLLHVLSRADRPSAGEVTLDGQPLGSWDQTALARRRAVLPQTPSIAFPFRVVDVVALGRSPHAGRTTHAKDVRVVDAAMRETETAHFAERVYSSLSGGERQRVHLARVLAQVWSQEPDGSACYLLLDEPTNNLDLAHQHRLLASARRFARRGNGVLAVLHDPNLAATYADRIVMMKGGCVAADGPPEEVLTPSLLADVFGLPVEVLEYGSSGRPLMVPMPFDATQSTLMT